MAKYRNYTDEDIIKAVKDSVSLAQVLRALNLKEAGGNYANMKRRIAQLSCDTSHWTKQGWNNGMQLKDWAEYKKVKNFKRHLISFRGHCCEDCGNTHWKDQLIKLEVHHIDGITINNSLDNLQLLCPNCHAYTDNYRKRKDTNSKDF